jgi:hypothetical protein
LAEAMSKSNRKKLREAVEARIKVDVAKKFPLNMQPTNNQLRAMARKAADQIVSRELKAIAAAKREGRIKETAA